MTEVVFVADQVSPMRGMEKALADLVVALDGGARITVVSLSGGVDPAFFYPVKLLGCSPGLARLVRGAVVLGRCLRDHRKVGPGAVVVAVGIWSAVPVLLAVGRNRGARVVIWEHSVLPWRLAHQTGVRLTANIVYRILRRRIDSVVAVSPSVQRTVEHLTGKQVPVGCIPNMLTSVVAANSLSQPSRQPSDGLIRLLGIGGLVPLKNWGRAIESMSELPQSYVLEIAGEGPDRRRLEALIARRGLGNRVRLLGHRSDVPQLLADCDVVVHPSFVETFGFSLMEAAIAGKPVVCLDMPVMNELVPTVIPGVACPNSSLGLAEGIRRVVEQQAQGLLTASTEGEESPAFRIRDNREEVRAAWLELLQ